MTKSRKSKISKTLHLEYIQISKEKNRKTKNKKLENTSKILEKDRTIYGSKREKRVQITRANCTTRTQ
jgi:hypothetical protein